jgi:hypothetical protein
MSTFGQIVGVISTMAFLVAGLLAALGRLSFRLFLIVGIAGSLTGLLGSTISGSAWVITLRVIALVSFAAALAIHRYVARLPRSTA